MITVFANSTLYTSMFDENTHGGVGCLELLKNRYEVNGLFTNGLTVLHVLPSFKIFAKERNKKNIVIINLGAVEAFSHPAENFLYWASYFLLENGCTSQFETYCIPKMVKATHALSHKREEFFRILDLPEFKSLFAQILLLLEGMSVIVLGMNKPNMNSQNARSHWIEQASEFNEGIKSVCGNNDFIDIWNILENHVVDTTHLHPFGHRVLFNAINERIQKIYDSCDH